MTDAPTDSAHLARTIAVACYGREPRIEPLARFNTLVYRLRFDDGAKILKLAKGADASSLAKELRLIDLVRRHGIPAPAVEHADRQAALVGRPFFIMASAGDHTVADWAEHPSEPGYRLFTEMGAILARIHGITLPASGDIGPDGIVPRDPHMYRQRLHRLAEWVVEQRLLGADEIARFMSLDFPPLVGLGLCHSDFHPVQCIVADERITAVVDWASAWAGNTLIDLGIVHAYLDYYCSPLLIQAFLDGYASRRALSADYGPASLPVRMAHALGLLRVWHGQGRRLQVDRAAELYRAYLASL